MAVITPWNGGPFEWAPVVEAWRAGQLVGFPTESGYVATGCPLAPQAVQNLGAISCGSPLALLLTYPAEAFDWLPYLRGPTVRLARSFWPGPLVLLSSAGVKEGLASRLPGESLKALLCERKLGLACPSQVGLRQAAYYAQIPIVLGWPDTPARTAQELARDGLELIVDAGAISETAVPTVVAIDERISVVKEGAIDADRIRDALPCRIVFLCTGNTCRSPMAQMLCELLLAERYGCSSADLQERGFVVQSAGLAALAGEAASPEGVEVVRGYGGNLSEHRSRPITYELLVHADFVFTMTFSHLRLLRDLQVDVGPQPRLLSLGGDDVADPIGGPPETYHQCAAQIRSCLEELLPELLESGYSQP